MAIDMFMKVEGINGEAKDANHKDWTDIESFDWGAEQPGSMTTGGGGGAGSYCQIWCMAFRPLSLLIARLPACHL